MRVTVSREASESGLARVCQSPRGYVLKVDGKVVGRVGWSHSPDKSKPWHWYGSGHNSASAGTYFATKEEARDNAVAFIKAQPPVSPAKPDRSM